METTDEEFVSDLPDEGSAEAGEDAVKKLRERLKKAVQEKQEYLEGWQRARADFANYKREEASLHGDKEERIKAKLVESLLPALDALELACQHHDDPTLAMLEKQFLGSLQKIGVERFGKAGEEFSPHMHEALAKEGEGETVLKIKRSGYKIGETIIRPAQVVI